MSTATTQLYEALVLLKPSLEADNPDASLKSVEQLIQSLKGKIVRVDKLGRRRLGYEINRFKDASVTALILNLEPSAVDAFKRACALNEDLLRVIITRRDPKTLDAAPAPRPAFDRGERGGDRGGRFDRGDRAPQDRGERAPQSDRGERAPQA